MGGSLIRVSYRANYFSPGGSTLWQTPLSVGSVRASPHTSKCHKFICPKLALQFWISKIILSVLVLEVPGHPTSSSAQMHTCTTSDPGHGLKALIRQCHIMTSYNIWYKANDKRCACTHITTRVKNIYWHEIHTVTKQSPDERKVGWYFDTHACIYGKCLIILP